MDIQTPQKTSPINTNEKILSVADLLHHIVKNIHIIIAVSLVLAIVGFCFSSSSDIASYTATTRICIVPFENVENTEAQFSTILVNDCKALIANDNVSSAVIEKLGLDTDPSDLTGCVEVVSSSNCRILQINVTYGDDETAVSVANAVRDESISQIKSVVEVEDVRVVHEAEVTANSSDASPLFTAVLAAAAGALVSCCLFVLMYIFDNTIRTEKDVADCLDVRVLGVIPESRSVSVASVSVKNR